MMNIKHDLLLLKISAIKMKEKKKRRAKNTKPHKPKAQEDVAFLQSLCKDAEHWLNITA